MKVKKPVFSLLLALALALTARAQQLITVRGKITSEDGLPVPGATITIKHTAKKIVATADGSFSLTLQNPTDTLVCSAAGFVTAEFLGNTRGWLTIVLKKKSVVLDEVILNSGYQEFTRDKTTGSYVKLNETLLNRRVSTDLLSRLKGLAPGILYDKNAGNNLGLTVRGISSIFASSQPLIVVDNFPYTGNIQNINPNDVESITVLKDAAAASIWGASAGNGVVVITTKKGRYNQPVNVSLNTNITVTQKPDYFYYPQMTSNDFIDLEQFLFSQGFYNSTIGNTTNRPVLSPVIETLQQLKNGAITQAQADATISSYRNQDVRNDMEKYFYQNAINQQYALTLNGGSVNANYFLGLGLDKDRSSLVGNQYNRYSITIKNTFQPAKNLQLQTAVFYTQSYSVQNNTAGNALAVGGGKSSLYPYARLVDETGQALPVPKDYRFAYIDTAGQPYLLDWRYRPLDEIRLSDNTSKLQNLSLNASARYEFSKSLDLQLSYRYTVENKNNRIYYSPDSYYTRNLVNLFSQLQNDRVIYGIPQGGILDNAFAGSSSHNLRFQANYSRQWALKHMVLALAGAEISQSNATAETGRNYGYNKDFLTYANIDYANSYPVFGNLSWAQTIPSNISFSDMLDRFVSVFTNLSYTYNQKYTITASARKDASNLFGVKTNQKGIPLWSAGIAWNLHKENFFTIPWLNLCRLRASFGYNGNIDNNQSANTVITYAPAPDVYTNLPYATVSNPSNPRLRWEKVGILNLGLDLALFNSRLTGTIEYYQKQAKDLFASAPVDPTSGFSRLILNSANIKGRGFDIQLNTVNTTGKIKWSTTWILSYSRNKVAKYLNSFSTARSYVGAGNTFNPLEGKDVYALFSYKWAGLDPANGDPQGYLQGQVSKNYSAIRNDSISSLKYHGSAAPLYFGAIRNTITLGHFAISANVIFKLNYYFRRTSINYAGLINSWTTHSDYADRWQKPGDELFTNVPSFIYPANSYRDEFYTYSEATVERADHIRLQDIRIDYEWKNKNAKQKLIRKMVIYVYADNLGIIWRANKHHLDPDYFKDDLPAPKSVAIGCKIDF